MSNTATVPATALGHFVRHDLMSTDPSVSETFFAGLFGWQVEHKQVMGMTVRVIVAGEHRVGAIMPFDARHGYASHWMGYVADDDVDGSAARVAGLGGSLCMPAMDVGPLGRMAHLDDPDGALILSLKPAYPATVSPDGLAGTVCWNELLADDPAKAVAFYSGLYGWTVDHTKDLGPMGTYTVMAKDGVHVGGIMKRQPEMGPRATWLFYFQVADLEGALTKVGDLGGKALTPIMPIPGIGRFAMCQEPTGAEFALFGR